MVEAPSQLVQEIEPFRVELFDRWYTLFVETVDESWAGPIAETAKQLGTSEANVYIARSRVMARLKEIVKQLEADV